MNAHYIMPKIDKTPQKYKTRVAIKVGNINPKIFNVDLENGEPTSNIPTKGGKMCRRTSRSSVLKSRKRRQRKSIKMPKTIY